MPSWGNLVFSSPATYKAAVVQSLHSFIMTWVIFVGCVVVLYFFSSLFCPWYARHTRGFGALELLFSLMPVVILWVIFMPSAVALYYFDSFHSSTGLTVKVVGRQWYWEYEIYFEGGGNTGICWVCEGRDLRGSSVSFESHMIANEGVRLGEVDQPLVLPFGVPIKFAITSGDVNHSWFMPAFGIKSDAIPGRINAVSTLIAQPGKYYGACAELCGEYHGFMPIVAEVVGVLDFFKWALNCNS